MFYKNMIGPVGTRVSFVDSMRTKPKKRYGVLVKFDRSYGTYKVVDSKGNLWSIYAATNLASDVPEMQLRAMANKERAVVIEATRSDRYTHYGVVVNGKSALSAGCQRFTTLAAALEHWKGRKRYTWAYSGYPGRPGAHKSNIARLIRAREKKFNSFSIAFARKLERLRVKGAK